MPKIKYYFMKAGIALPMVLISISGLFLLSIGMLTMVSLEGKTARAYSAATQAELAVDSGLSNALSLISEISCRDDSLAFRVDDPSHPKIPSHHRPLGYREQFFTYGAVFENDAWQAIPLFSHASRRTLGDLQIEVRELIPHLTQYALSAETLTPITEHDQNIPRAQWIELPADSDQANNTTVRYAFWIEDLSGRIDGKHVAAVARNLGISTAEMDPSTIFQSASSKGSMPSIMNEKRNSIRTSASLRNWLDPIQASRIEPYITYLPEQSPEPKMIPHGYDYSDAGQKAQDLNAFVASCDVTGLSDHISRNLPKFSARRGGFPASSDYINTLAASMIDYADADSNPTYGSGFRGVDSYPFVNELFDRYEWISNSNGNVNIKMETFVELWNPSQLPISGELRFTNMNRHKINIPPASTQDFIPVEYPPLITTMPPNGFLVILLGEYIYAFPQGAFTPSQLNFVETTRSNYSLKWNKREIDYARGGLQRTSGILRAGASERKWKGNASPAHDTSIGQFGDPRASIYIESPVMANSYDVNSNWGGRALKRSIASTKPTLPYAEVRINQWPDSGSSSFPGMRPVGDQRRPGVAAIMNSDGTPYANGFYPTNQPERAPSVISNSGRYQSLCELGHIYDPAQWSDVNTRNPTANSSAGGGFTLAIGRPEFLVFDNEGQRAAQLLDLFSLHSANSGANTHARRININTAPREVLRCLIAGVSLNADPMAPDAKPRDVESIGDLFADRVIAHRNQSPLRGYSDLNMLRIDPLKIRDSSDPDDSSFFGNPSFYENTPKVIDNDDPSDLVEWNNAGREELMRKVMDLVTFHSKTYRIVVAGEVRSKSGKRLARATREFHFTVEPERDSNGLAIRNGKPRISKHYEISF